MARIEELDHLFKIGDGGIVHYEDNAALNDRLQEWLETPEGTVADLPAWGNRLAYMKHEPPGVHLNIMAEMDIIEKMPRDIDNLSVSGILVEFKEIDLLWIGINFSLGGSFTSEVTIG